MASKLAPGLLLAAPRLGDPNFERTVVLLGHHNEGGALGWVLNGKPVMPVGKLLHEAALVPPGVTLPEGPSFRASARVGGPVMSGSAWLIFERDEGALVYEEEHPLGGRFFATGARAAIEAVARGEGPTLFRLVLGYAGWGPGQLEGEIQQGAWLPVSVDGALLRDLESQSMWDAAYRLVGAVPFGFSGSTRGSA